MADPNHYVNIDITIWIVYYFFLDIGFFLCNTHSFNGFVNSFLVVPSRCEATKWSFDFNQLQLMGLLRNSHKDMWRDFLRVHQF